MAYSNQSTGSFNQWFHRDLDMGIIKELKGLENSNGIYASWNHNNPTVYDPNNTKAFYAGNYWYNFYTWFDLVKPVSQNDRLYGDLNLTYKFNNNISIKGTYRKQQNTTWFEERYSSDLLASGTQTFGNCPECKGFYATGESFSNRENVEFLANYTKKFNDFNVNFNVGTDFFRWLLKGNSLNTVNGFKCSEPVHHSRIQKMTPNVFNDRVEEKYRAVYAIGSFGYKNFLFADFTLT